MMSIVFAIAAFATSELPAPVVIRLDGGFIIESKHEQVTNSYPIPAYTHKNTTLKWATNDKSVTYILSDDGESLSATFMVGPEESFCIGGTGPIRYEAPELSFSVKSILSKNCQKYLSETELHRAKQEITDNITRYYRAYRAFVDETTRLFGTSQRRCVAFDRGNHGSICRVYSDQVSH